MGFLLTNDTYCSASSSRYHLLSDSSQPCIYQPLAFISLSAFAHPILFSLNELLHHCKLILTVAQIGVVPGPGQIV